MTTHYMIEFDRIGGDPANRDRIIEVAGDDPDRIAADVSAVIRRRRYLTSRFFDVTVDLEQGVVWIEHGRFGTGRLHRVVLESVAPKAP